MIVKCTYCNKEFNKSKSAIERTKTGQHFCCVKHSGLYRSQVGRMEYTCAECGKKFSKLGSLKNKNDNHFCSRQCYGEWRSKNLRGKNNYNPKAKNSKDIKCLECGKPIRRATWRFQRSQKQFCSTECKKEYMIGENSGFWKGGFKNQMYRRIRGLKKYEIWRNSIFFRDNATCQHCESTENLDVHHKKELIEIIREYHLKTIKDANNCEALWDVDNGITLCVHCHAEEHPDLRYLFNKRVA